MGWIHYLDERARLPLCHRPDTERWSWTLAPRAVTCPECLRLLAADRPLGVPDQP